ncbi:MAG: MFS transporter [Christensenellaceae bacterium]|jgi:PPP family 3-phenylpropionic acid transporter
MQRLRGKLAGVDHYYYKLSFIEFFANCALMAYLSYLTVYLQSVGVSKEEIGIINGLNTMFGAIGSMSCGVLSDKWRSIKKVYVACLLPAIFLYSIVPLVGQISVSALFVLLPLGAMFRMPPSMGLTDNMVMQIAEKRRLVFGSIRMWGTIGYALMGFLLTELSKHLGITISFYAYAAVALIAVLATVLFVKEADVVEKSDTPHKSIPLKEMGFSKLFRNYYFMAYLIYSCFASFCTSTGFGILPYLVEDLQISVDHMATVLSLQSVLEIPLLYLTKKLQTKWSLPTLITFHGVLHSLRLLLLSQVGSFLPLALVSMLQGLAGGIEFGSGANYIYYLSPEKLKATAYMLKGVAGSISGVAANFLSGYLVVSIGSRKLFFLIGIIMTATTAFFILSTYLGERVFGQTLPASVKRLKVK